VISRIEDDCASKAFWRTYWTIRNLLEFMASPAAARTWFILDFYHALMTGFYTLLRHITYWYALSLSLTHDQMDTVYVESHGSVCPQISSTSTSTANMRRSNHYRAAPQLPLHGDIAKRTLRIVHYAYHARKQ
jgi:hypothetical protein